MSARRWLAHFLPAEPEPNPLAVGLYCPDCGTRLDKEGRACPIC